MDQKINSRPQHCRVPHTAATGRLNVQPDTSLGRVTLHVTFKTRQISSGDLLSPKSSGIKWLRSNDRRLAEQQISQQAAAGRCGL